MGGRLDQVVDVQIQGVGQFAINIDAGGFFAFFNPRQIAVGDVASGGQSVLFQSAIFTKHPHRAFARKQAVQDVDGEAFFATGLGQRQAVLEIFDAREQGVQFGAGQGDAGVVGIAAAKQYVDVADERVAEVVPGRFEGGEVDGRCFLFVTGRSLIGFGSGFDAPCAAILFGDERSAMYGGAFGPALGGGFDVFAHLYTFPLGATRTTFKISTSRSTRYTTRQSPARNRNASCSPCMAVTLAWGANGSAAISSTASRMALAFFGWMRRSVLMADLLYVVFMRVVYQQATFNQEKSLPTGNILKGGEGLSWGV